MLQHSPHATRVETDIVHNSLNSDIEDCIHDNRMNIAFDAALCGVDYRTFERQVRLHLPVVSSELLGANHRASYEAVRPVSLVRAAGIGQELAHAQLMANASLLLPKCYTARRGSFLVADDGSAISLSFRTVRPGIGNIYQSRLHYLRAARADTWLHFGLFLPGASYPLTYVSLSVCDRPYIADSLVAGNLNCRPEECLVITRMFGLPGLPKNLMSLTLKHVIKVLRQTTSAKLLLTAFNPLLGFSGAAFRASGFHPFASAPVAYQYTDQGEFTTRRSGPTAQRTLNPMPPNILMVRGIERAVQKEIEEQVDFVKISESDHDANVSAQGSLPRLAPDVWLKQLREYRDRLQVAWSMNTVHPSYLEEKFDSDSPRGQCGVSSAWLAQELYTLYQVEATYCYGDLLFDDDCSPSVMHHCWVEIGPEDDPTRMVIDLTCDQAENITEPVLCATHQDLISQDGMHYVSHTRSSLHRLNQDRVWHRYENLLDAMIEQVEQDRR
jgi:hypothetical protein